jgi:TPR repeat protein
MSFFANIIRSKKSREQESEQKLTESQNALREGRYADAFELLEPLASSGNPEAQARLAFFNEELGIPLGRAHIYLQTAAEQGHTAAESVLGFNLLHGKGCSPNWERAMAFLKKAAAKNDAYAMHSIGTCYVDGIGGVKKSFEDAVIWFRKAGDCGYLPSIYNMAVSYTQGTGVPKNDREAFKWWEKAANLGLPVAQHNIAESYRQGIGVEQNKQLADHWFAEAAKNR